MQSQELQTGDVLLAPDGSSVVYDVLDVLLGKHEVVAAVKFREDGGTGTRTWAPGVEVPHVTPDFCSECGYVHRSTDQIPCVFGSGA